MSGEPTRIPGHESLTQRIVELFLRGNLSVMLILISDRLLRAQGPDPEAPHRRFPPAPALGFRPARK